MSFVNLSLGRIVAALLAASSIFCPKVFAQGPIPDAPSASIQSPAPTTIVSTPAYETEHKFWDKENVALFAATAALAASDFTVTNANLQSGGRELNPIVRLFGRSKVGLAANFIGEAAGGISLSYFFHKTRHHKLERIVSFVNIGTSAGAVGYGLKHR